MSFLSSRMSGSVGQGDEEKPEILGEIYSLLVGGDRLQWHRALSNSSL